MPEVPVIKNRLQSVLDRLAVVLSGAMILLLPDIGAALVAAYLIILGVTGVLVPGNPADKVTAPPFPLPHWK